MLLTPLVLVCGAAASFAPSTPRRLAAQAPGASWRTPIPPRANFPSYEAVSPVFGIERDDYQVNVGRAIDHLRDDYPKLLRVEPHLSIYAETIVLKASGKQQLEGIDQYERSFALLRFLRNATLAKDEVTYRLNVEDSTIRVRWNAKLWIRDPLAAVPGAPPVVFVDGLSVYELNTTGFIRSHALENVEVTPPAVKVAFDWAWPLARMPSPIPVPVVPTSHLHAMSRPARPRWST